MASNSTFRAERTELNEILSFSIMRTGASRWECSIPWAMLADAISTLNTAAGAATPSVTKGTNFQVKIYADFRSPAHWQWLGNQAVGSFLTLYKDEIPALVSVLTALQAATGAPIDLDARPSELSSQLALLDNTYVKWRNVRLYGATGDGVTDDTAAVNAAVAACIAGDVLYFPAGRYRVTTAITVPANVELRGDGVKPVWGSIGTDFNSINAPTVAPWLTGSVLIQAGAGQNGFQFTAAGATQHASGIGVLFADAIKFVNTGHGFYALPPAHLTGRNNGVSGSHWDNLVVFGHDGNHYGFYSVNGIYNRWSSCQSFGGGVAYIGNNSAVDGHYGNFQADSLYGQTFVGGSAHGLHLAGLSDRLNMLLFNRPQVTVSNMSATYGVTAPTSSQHMLHSEGNVHYVSFIQADFETNVSAGVVPPYGVWYMDPASYIPTWADFRSESRWRTDRYRRTDGHYVLSGTGNFVRVTPHTFEMYGKPGEFVSVSLNAYLVNTSGGYLNFDIAFLDGSGNPLYWFSSEFTSGVPNGLSGWGRNGVGEGGFQVNAMCQIPAGISNLLTWDSRFRIALFAKASGGMNYTLRADGADPFVLAATVLPR